MKVYAAIGAPRHISEDPEPVVFMLPGTSIDVDRSPLGHATYLQGHVDAPAGLVQHYTYSGGDLTVSVQEISPPFTVTAGDTTFTPGASVRFSAGGDLNGSSFRDYYFVPGDTAAEPAWNGLLSGTYRVRACSGAPGFSVCPYAPKEAGRMYLGATYRGSWGFAASKVVRPAQTRISLSCVGTPGLNPVTTVTRGDTITCTARKEPANAPGELKITGWSFEGRARTDGNSTSTEWKGVLVRGGTVTVAGTIGGSHVLQDSVKIQITPRRWRRLKAELHEDGHGDLPEPEAVNSVDDLAHTHFLAPTSYDTARVRSGPNTGWQYLKSFPDTVTTVVHINKAFRRGSAWYVLQTGGRKRDPGTNQVLGDYCRGSDMPTIERLTREHEGIISSGSLTSHVDVLRDWFRANSPADSLEAAVAFVGDGGGEIFDDVLQAKFYEHVTRPALEDDANQRHTNAQERPGRVPPAPFPCYLRPWN